MKINRLIFLALTLLSLSFQSCQQSDGQLVKTIGEFNEAVKNASPGDKIILANGNWKDAELLIKAKGTADSLITISAESKGGVILSGESNVRIAGEYLLVSGLVFKNGNTPTNVVISFRKKKGVYANNCRLTECVIDNYNNPERFSTESWVDLYGKNNRIDHCYFIDKRCQGVTLTVRLPDEDCQNNNHQIDHNYFGHRQNLGSNGGETIRIGTSKYSLTNSGTLVDCNYFEETDGEHEIVSNKSCGNVFSNNVFYECRGTLTFRHGNDNVAKGNFFLGNGKEHTGGIRIINKRNKAVNNYLYELKGTRFRGALVVMNGVPNSPINRYHQVDGGVFSNNTFINCDNIQLCAGSDKERSLAPINSVIENNLFYHDSKTEIFTVYDDISGIEFKNNYLSKGVKPVEGARIDIVDLQKVKNKYGLPMLVAPGLNEVGCNLDRPIATTENCGPNWYAPINPKVVFDSGTRIKVLPGLNTLLDAIHLAGAGDILELEKGVYTNSKDMRIAAPITIYSTEETLVTSERNSMFWIENGGALKLKGLTISGENSPDVAGNSIVSTSKSSMNKNYKLIVEGCTIKDLNVNHSFNFLKTYKNTFADSVVVRESIFENVTGHVLELNAEDEDLGIYNAEYVILENSQFKNIQGTVLNLYRGGTDESTFGPIFYMDSCLVTKVGVGKRNKTVASLAIHGVQISTVRNSEFTDSKPINLFLTNGEPVTSIVNNKFNPEIQIVSNSNDYFFSGNQSANSGAKR